MASNLTGDGEAILEQWSTAEEKDFLRQLASGQPFCRKTRFDESPMRAKPIDKLILYLEWAEHYRTDWDGLDRPEIMGYATKLFWQARLKEGEVTQQTEELPNANCDEANV